MDNEIKSKWTHALRSGVYKQGSGKLYNDGTHCCLGVLGCVLGLNITSSGREFVEDKEVEEIKYGIYPILTHKTGLTSSQKEYLFSLNDCSRKTFNEIADYIETNI